MYSHFLVPTDGSPLSLKGARAAADLAKKVNAKITAVYVIPPYEARYVGEGLYFRNKIDEQSYMDGMRKHADEALAKATAFAREADVPSDSKALVGPAPWQTIIEAAGELNCDTIVMASHGYGGISKVVLGSQTDRVLSHSKIPVLVCR